MSFFFSQIVAAILFKKKNRTLGKFRFASSMLRIARSQPLAAGFPGSGTADAPSRAVTLS